MKASRERQRVHDNMIREEAIRLASELTQRQDEACRIATKTDLEKMVWLIQNLSSPFPIFIISPSWLKHAGDGVFVSHWYRFAPRGLLLPMFGYTNRMRYPANDCRQAYQGLTIRPELFFHGIRSTNLIKYTSEMIGNYVNRPAKAQDLWSMIGRVDIPEPTRSWYLNGNVSYVIYVQGSFPYLKLDKSNIPSGRELFFSYTIIPNPLMHPSPCFDCLNQDMCVLLDNDSCVDGPMLYGVDSLLSELIIV